MAETQYVPECLLRVFPPRGDLLLSKCAKYIDDALLRQIAEADYGDDADPHFQALKLIRDTLQVPAPLKWEPKEVLELTRWSEPKDDDDHAKRAFACAVLLVHASRDEEIEYVSAEHDSLICCVDSALALGDHLPLACGRYLVAHLQRFERGPYREYGRSFYALALTLLTCLTQVRELNADEWAEVIAWVESERDSDWAGVDEWDRSPPTNILDLEVPQRRAVWVKLATMAAANAKRFTPDACQDRLVGLLESVATPPG